MKLVLQLVFVFLLSSNSIFAQSKDAAFIVLGDMHYDKLEHHDLDYVMSRPQDFQQIFNEYPQYTAFFLPKFLNVIKKQSESGFLKVEAVAQLGDLVQGVAGTPPLARQMNRGVVDLLYATDLKVPWILTKGNHDVSNSPGQADAWEEVIRPFIEGQVKKPIDHGMYTYSLNKDVDFFVLDQFFSVDRNVPEIDMVRFLEKELGESKAKYKFVMTHQPVVPVTDRCWHLLSGIRRPVTDDSLRSRFLNLLAKHNVIVLSAHLHQYSVLSRSTASGNIVQVMINSVNRSLDPPQPKGLTTQYKGENWVEENPNWQPFNKDLREKILSAERKHIKSFRRADLPGYAIISISSANGDVLLTYYNGLSEKAYEQINLTDLQKH